MGESLALQSKVERHEGTIFWVAGFVLLFVLPVLNVLPSEDSWLHVSDFALNRFGKFLAFAILALGLDLIWGYTGILSLGQGVFFGLGAYCMGMHLMLTIGGESVYGSALPDFMVWNQVTALPFFWKPFYSFTAAVLAGLLVPAVFALLFGFLAFRSRIRGVYFAIITQALALMAWLVFNRNETNLGGTNGLTDFKTILGFRLSEPGTQLALYVITVLCLGGSLSALPLDHRVAGGPGPHCHPRQRAARSVFRLFAGQLQTIRLRRVGRASGSCGYSLRAASRDYYSCANGRPALARNGHLGGGGRQGDPGRSDRRSGGC